MVPYPPNTRSNQEATPRRFRAQRGQGTPLFLGHQPLLLGVQVPGLGNEGPLLPERSVVKLCLLLQNVMIEPLDL